ncbi:TSC22 domain family protein 4, partial [Apteryx mantelli]|uniref:TSC22 domain family protein 1 n=1 Tax=Apteryx mantelli TaxID=2696672 RepID=A0ABM4G1P5_9AVES
APPPPGRHEPQAQRLPDHQRDQRGGGRAAAQRPRRRGSRRGSRRGGRSRFRVVRLAQGPGEPYRRGRWTCFDFYEREREAERAAAAAAAAAAARGRGGGAAAARLPHSLDSRLEPPPPPPSGAAPPRGPLPPPGAALTRSLGAAEPGPALHRRPGPPRRPPAPRRQPRPLPRGPDGLGARLSLARSMFAMGAAPDGDDDGSAGSGMIAIDNKIEQAMDLVKSHLLLAVREEVEVLREQIKELSERNAALERENGLLRALASPAQLARLGPRPRGPPA